MSKVVVVNDMTVVRPGHLIPLCGHSVYHNDCLTCAAGTNAKILKARTNAVWVEYPDGDIALLEFKDNRWRFYQASKNEG